jgi:hypothetical protein
VLRCAGIWKASNFQYAVRKMNTSPDEIRAEVRKFWNFFSSKSKTQFADMYLPSATVFAVDARRMELARLMLVRRERELFGPASSVAAKLGPIDVQFLGKDLAVASYPFHLSITRALPGGKDIRRKFLADAPRRFSKATKRVLCEFFTST